MSSQRSQFNRIPKSAPLWRWAFFVLAAILAQSSLVGCTTGCPAPERSSEYWLRFNHESNRN
jgi:hypothetical protein